MRAKVTINLGSTYLVDSNTEHIFHANRRHSPFKDLTYTLISQYSGYFFINIFWFDPA